MQALTQWKVSHILWLIHHLPKIRMIFFGHWSIKENGAIRFEKCPLVTELKLKIKRSTIFSGYQFHPREWRSFFNYDSTFLIYGEFLKKVSFRFLKDLCKTKSLSTMFRRCSYLPHAQLVSFKLRLNFKLISLTNHLYFMKYV